MAHTDRDIKRYHYKHHNEHCTNTIRIPREGFKYLSHYIGSQGCVCNEWHDYHWYAWPAPSWWNRDIRRAERAHTRNLMQRARTGHIDWERVEDTRGDDYYW